jgi:hypothetical protein
MINAIKRLFAQEESSIEFLHGRFLIPIDLMPRVEVLVMRLNQLEATVAEQKAQLKNCQPKQNRDAKGRFCK